MFNTKTQLSDESKKILDNINIAWTTCESPNNGIKIETLSKRVRVFKNDFVLEADILENGKITIYNNKYVQNKNTNENKSFIFVGSTHKTIKKIGELLIALSEIK